MNETRDLENMADLPTPMPAVRPAPPPKPGWLAQPDANSLPAQTRNIMQDAVNKAHEQVVGELRGLQAAIERLIQGLEATRDQLNVHMSAHFQLGAEAVAFAAKVTDRLSDITHGEGQVSQSNVREINR